MTASSLRSAWFIRIGCFLAGLILVGITPYLWRTAEETGFPITPEPSRIWQIAAVLSLVTGGFLLWIGAEYRNPWQRLRRFMKRGDNGLLITSALLLTACGSLAYFVLNERFLAACWYGPFAWVLLVSCPIYAVLTLVAWLVTIILALLLYFGAVHHPILRLLGGGQRSLLADDPDEYL